MELLDVYNNEGKPTGKVVQRGTPKDSYSDGEHVGIVQLFIENNNGEFLIERSAKETGYRYLPVGGHIISGETPLEAIIRETKEEIDLKLDENEIISLGFFTLDFPVRFIYYMKKNIELDTLKLQTDEVRNVTYMSVEQMMYLVENGLMHPVHKELIPKVLELSRKNNKSK